MKRVWLLPLSVGLVLSMMTYFAWELACNSVNHQGQVKFENQIREIRHQMANHISSAVDALYGAQGLFAASKSVERDEWAAYTKSLRLKERYPGVVALGFSERVPAEEKEAFIQAVRADVSMRPEGYPDFTIHPETEAPEYIVGKYTEPFEITGRSIGFDLNTEPERRAAFEQARDTGEATASPILPLFTNQPTEKGLVIFLPVYKKKMDSSTTKARRENFMGLVAAAIDAKTLSEQASEKYNQTDNIYCRIRARGAGNSPVLIYQSPQLSDDSTRTSANFSEKLSMPVCDQIWYLEFYSGPGFSLEFTEKIFPWFVLFGGLLISILVAATLYLLSTANARSVYLANTMTKELRETQERTRLIIDTAMDAVMLMNEEGLVIDWSSQAETIFGWTAKEAIGRRLSDLIIPSFYRNAHEEGLKRFLATGVGLVINRRIEMTGLRKNGTEVPVELSMTPFKQRGKYIFSIFLRDIMNKKKLESQLLQSQKMEMMGTLAGGIAHDLNNQLTPVIGYLDLVIADIPPENTNRELLQEVRKSAKRCAEMIQRIKDVSKPSAHTKDIFKIQKTFNELSKLLLSIIPSTIKKEMICDENIWPIFGNENEIETVLINLCANSRDAMMDSDGTLSIRASNKELSEDQTHRGFKPGPYICIQVSDTGVGIAQEDIDRIFEPFFSKKNKEKGTGLGLTMVANIVSSHGGWIDVDSTPGQGTVFSIYIPARPGQQEKQEPEVSTNLAGCNGTELILFADDEENVRKLGKSFLEKLSYHAIFACDGEEAIQIYTKRWKEIGGVVLDLTMPKITGRQTLKNIREINPKAKIVVQSGYTSEGESDEFLKLGAAAYLHKPYTLVSFAKTLRTALDS